MKVLLGNPAFRSPIEGDQEKYMFGAGMRFPWSILKDKNEFPRYAMFPFFLSYAAALLERDGFEVFVLDGAPLNLDDQEFIGHVFDVQPDVIVFAPNTAGFSRTLDLINSILV